MGQATTQMSKYKCSYSPIGIFGFDIHELLVLIVYILLYVIVVMRSLLRLADISQRQRLMDVFMIYMMMLM